MKIVKGFASAALHRIEQLLLRLRVRVQSLLNITGSYHPNPFDSRSENADQRACHKRFEAFSAALPPGPLSCVDIGCHIGYFTFRMAERGGICIGLDTDRNAISYARGLASLHGAVNTSFLQWEITPGNVLGVPSAEVIICMSVFHHWTRKLGLEQATQIMDGVAQRCTYLVFETGQSDETDTRWADLLAFMKPDPETWIRRFLAARGFKDVQRIGTFPTTLSAVPRGLYLARK